MEKMQRVLLERRKTKMKRRRGARRRRRRRRKSWGGKQVGVWRCVHRGNLYHPILRGSLIFPPGSEQGVAKVVSHQRRRRRRSRRSLSAENCA